MEKKRLRGKGKSNPEVFNAHPIVIQSNIDFLKAPWTISNSFMHAILQLELGS